MTQQQLLHHKPRLDRLPQPDVVGDQQRRSRHPQRPNQRLELIVLDRDPAPERRLQRPLIRARHGAPTHRVQERVELRRVVERFRRDGRKLSLLDDGRAGLDLPHHLEFLTRRVILHRDERDQMLNRAPVACSLCVAGRVGDDPHAPPNASEPARLRSQRGSRVLVDSGQTHRRSRGCRGTRVAPARCATTPHLTSAVR